MTKADSIDTNETAGRKNVKETKNLPAERRFLPDGSSEKSGGFLLLRLDGDEAADSVTTGSKVTTATIKTTADISPDCNAPLRPAGRIIFMVNNAHVSHFSSLFVRGLSRFLPFFVQIGEDGREVCTGSTWGKRR